MIVLDGTEAALVAGVLALWLVAGVSATILGIRRSAKARFAHAEAERLAALIAAAPAAPLIVTGTGRIEEDGRLADWLGLRRSLATLTDLADEQEGFARPDVEALARDVATTAISARGFARRLAMPASGRVLLVRGSPGLGSGRVMLWFVDMTESERETARLAGEADRLGQALDALSALIEAAPFPMWHRGPDLRLALVNGAYVRAVEADSAAEVVDRGLELLEANSAPFAIPADARDLGAVSVRTAPAIIAGARRTIRIVDVPLGEAGIAGYAFDVEELEEARADLRRFVDAQRDMLDRLSAGVAQFAGDQSLVFCNGHFLRLFEMEPEWLADRPEFDRILERMREAQRAPESRDFPGWKAGRRLWFNATAPVEENWLLPAGTHLRVVAQPLPDGGLLLIFEDRTEQLQLASARDTLLRVRTATFDNLFEAIAVFAGDGRLHLWNSRFRDVWNVQEEELARHPRVDMLVQWIAPKLADPSRAGLIRELVRIATVERQARGGRIALVDGRHFEFAAVPMPDGNALFTLLDITASRVIEEALRDRNEALEEADRVKTAFVANISYELRVPLTTISGFAEMLEGGYAGDLPETAREYVVAINSAVARLSTLIGDVLDLTQSEAGSLPLAAEPVAIAMLVRDAAADAADVARARGLSLTFNIPADSSIVIGDSRRLRQGVDHILRNALSYTQDGGRILVRTAIVGGMVEIVISDNGPGMPAHQRERMLQRFNGGAPAQGDGASSPGLGLPLTHQLVEAHGGTLDLQSEEGRGTTVTIRLPLAGRAAASAGAVR
ncbi:histidine kinase [Sphingomonas oleivorans]|uniref:histidine kinase n=1 Tax=Sphingomonas oleivorans TaxID=1735121 RepID=A0A2T5FTK4_9SPHN|nr:PAS domain-containing sensor histidine kinase [Sphingomonas oleivorans]PTQ07400.1 histidine kinase [Sphingomonas oleivorans]